MKFVLAVTFHICIPEVPYPVYTSLSHTADVSVHISWYKHSQKTQYTHI